MAVSACGSSKPGARDQRLVSQYKRAIGCHDYARLRPAAGQHDTLIALCKESLAEHYLQPQVVTAFVYRSLNKNVLLVHMVFRPGGGADKASHNFLVDTAPPRIIGGYSCGSQ